ncbi:MAG: glycosyltransferase, partial [Lachnospiraceae bacterium]
MDLISVIVSCLNEEKAIPLFYEEMEKTRKKDFQNVDFEYIFIDDGSTDNTLKVMKELAKKDDKVKYISFSRNFGKEAAMYAGLNK